jgi:hypothetical protein
MANRKNPASLVFAVAFYVAVYVGCLMVFGLLLSWVGGDFFGVMAAGLLGSLGANWAALRFFGEGGLSVIGLWWNRASADNLAYGLLGGIGAAMVALAMPLATGAAHLQRIPGSQFALDGAAVMIVLVAAGSAGEEIFFRGYAFQALLARIGAWPAITGVGVVFGLLHVRNPNAAWLGIVNTAGFGVVFGYAYLRSRDLWLPIGLHFGWNFTLPLFGVNVSGLRMRMTGYELSWTAGSIWSGGEYGPEASILTSAVVVLLFVYIWKAPVRQQFSPLTGPSVGSTVCESSPPSQP